MYEMRPKQTTTVITTDFDGFDGSYVCIIDKNVPRKYVEHILQKASLVLPIDGGESCKSLNVAQQLFQALQNNHVGCDAHLVAIGGGSLTDLVGFVGSTFCRGVRLSFVPTTLLAMVDASIGGKNGVNLMHAKNRVGTIYQPERVILQVDLLETLEELQFRNGLVEMLKHELIAGTTDFEADLESLLQRDKKSLIRAIEKSIMVKMKIVEASAKDPEARHLLNFGHTIGHAIEFLEKSQISHVHVHGRAAERELDAAKADAKNSSAANSQRLFTRNCSKADALAPSVLSGSASREHVLSHGQAVAIGIMAECALGALSQGEIQKIRTMVRSLGLPLKLSKQYSIHEWQEAIQQDKKNKNGRARYVLLERIGKPMGCHEVDEKKLHTVLEWVNYEFDRCRS